MVIPLSSMFIKQNYFDNCYTARFELKNISMAAYQLELELEEIYAPLKKLGKFKAESDGKAKMDTGNYRSVLIVKDSAVTAVLKQILQELQEKSLFNDVWKGITESGRKLWVEQLRGFEVGETRFFRIEGFDVFPCQGYKVGVNIKVTMQ